MVNAYVIQKRQLMVWARYGMERERTLLSISGERAAVVKDSGDDADDAWVCSMPPLCCFLLLFAFFLCSANTVGLHEREHEHEHGWMGLESRVVNVFFPYSEIGS